MKVWRFHNRRYNPLDTTGAARFGGRWNPVGWQVLYTSMTYAGGLLELIAHATTPRTPPVTHVASLISIPDDVGVTVLEPPHPAGWDDPSNLVVARSLALPWLERGVDLCLVVPSVPGAPEEANVIVNGRHPQFGELAVERTQRIPLDERIWPRPVR